ncbi:MAG: metal-dependent hydrolase [Candidatus Thorarchaeota archaeon]|nr:metal-dependent hydrolase [Candidatus Thorarchaeota archaeon]
MPDVLTHLLVGVSLALLIRMDGPRFEQMLIVLGAVLIDIERPISWLLADTPLYWIGLGSAFHSILGAVVLSYFAAACFDLENSMFRERFKLVLIGCSSHLLLDMAMYPWAELGLQLLYPLKIRFSFHLLWPDFWWFPLIGVACLLGAFIIRYIIIFSSIVSTKSENDL